MDEEQQIEDQYAQPQFGGRGQLQGAATAAAPIIPVPGGLYGTETFEQVYGNRPQMPKTAYTSSGQLSPYGRRKFREQQEYDAAYKSWSAQQQAATQSWVEMENQKRAARDQFIQETTFSRDMANRDFEDNMKAQMMKEVSAATQILSQINPQNPEASKMYSALANEFVLAMKDEGFNRNINLAMSVSGDYDRARKAQQEQARSLQEQSSKVPGMLAEAGVPESEHGKFLLPNAPEGQKLWNMEAVELALGKHKKELAEGKVKPDKASVKREYLAAKAEYDYVLANPSEDAIGKEKMDAGRKLAEKKSNLLEFFPEVKDPSDLLNYAPGTDILLPDGSLKKVPQRTTTQTKP